MPPKSRRQKPESRRDADVGNVARGAETKSSKRGNSGDAAGTPSRGSLASPAGAAAADGTESDGTADVYVLQSPTLQVKEDLKLRDEKGKPINARYTLTVSGDCDGPISSAGGVITGAAGRYGLGTKYSYYNIKGKKSKPVVKEKARVVLGREIHSVGSCVFQNVPTLVRVSSVAPARNIEDVPSFALYLVMRRLFRLLPPDSIAVIRKWAGMGVRGSIGKQAFANCAGLIRADLPSMVATIEEAAFEHCTALTTVKLPPGLKVISYHAFAACTALKSITIPSGLTHLKSGAFCGCSALDSVDSDAGPFCPKLTAILPSTFRGCSSLTSFSVPPLVTAIGMRAFADCTWLAVVTLPHGLRSIDVFTFRSCEHLEKIDLPSTVECIGKGAFQGCKSLTTVLLPDLRMLGPGAFADCLKLEAVGTLEVDASGLEVEVPHTLPLRITEVPEGLFEGCAALEKITLREGVTVIHDGAFAGCTKLIDVVFPASLQHVGDALAGTALAVARMKEAKWVSHKWEGEPRVQDDGGPGLPGRLDAMDLNNPHEKKNKRQIAYYSRSYADPANPF